MPRVPQAPPPGIVRGATPVATKGRWWDANGVRFRQGQIQPIGGNVAIPNTGVSDLPRDCISWYDNSRVRWVVFGTDSKLYAYRFDTQVLYNITPTGVGSLDPPGAAIGFGLGYYGQAAYGTARDPATIGTLDIGADLGDIWSMDTFGEILLIVPTQDGHLYQWLPSTPTVLPTVIASAPTSNRGVIVTDQRQVVLLGAGGNPRNIAWSDQESLTVWAPAVTNLAGSKLLVTQSAAQSAFKTSQGILIFTRDDAHMMQYVGPPFAYGITMVAEGCGPMSLRCVAGVGSFVAWPGKKTWWAYNGTVQPFPSDIQDWFYSLVNRSYVGRVFGSSNTMFSEIWWDWPDEGATECNRYVAVNYVDQGRPWTIGVRTRTAASKSAAMDYPILGGDDGRNVGAGTLYLHEYGVTDNGNPRGANGLIYAESGAIELGEGDSRFHVKQLIFDAASNVSGAGGSLGYRFFLREQPYDQNELDTGLYTNIHNGLMDMRFSGRVARMRVEALDDSQWSVGRPRLDVVQGGRR